MGAVKEIRILELLHQKVGICRVAKMVGVGTGGVWRIRAEESKSRELKSHENVACGAMHDVPR